MQTLLSHEIVKIPNLFILQLSLDEEAKKEAWREHYERLLNVEFPWNPEDLSEESPVEGQVEPITLEIITKTIIKMASLQPDHQVLSLRC